MLLDRRAFLGALALASCARGQRRSGAADRVVSLSRDHRSSFALDAGARLVGRSRYCDYPAAAASVRAVGGFVDPSLEAILAVRPDLVVGVQGPGLRDFAERLGARGIDTYFPPTQSFAEIEAMLSGLADRLGVPEKGRELGRELERERIAVESALRTARRPRALLVFGLRPIVVAGPGSFAHEMLSLAGAENVIRGDQNRFPSLGVEQVLALDPEVVLDATGGVMREGVRISKDLPGWSELPALKRDRLVVVSDDRVLRPGPRVGQGLAVLARLVHPEVSLL
ncbi:MAG: helical backbone metal receptor [Polyangiaceae bacterium]